LRPGRAPANPPSRGLKTAKRLRAPRRSCATQKPPAANSACGYRRLDASASMAWMNAATSGAFAIKFPAYRCAHAGYARCVSTTGRLRQKTNFLNPINLICHVQSSSQKYSASHFPQISSIFAPSRLIEEGRTRRHDTWSAGCGGRDGVARARHCRAASSWSWGCERSIRAGRAALLRTAKACGSGTRGWCQAGGG
jgi:hypothetical protein